MRRERVKGTCVFCDRKNFEERIIAETSLLYYVATLGQITDGGYTLVIPKRHVSCVAAMREGEVAEIDRAAEKASSAIKAEYGIRPILFEHGVVGQTVQHAYLHLVPAKIRLCGRISRDFPGRVYFLPSLEILRWVRKNIPGGRKYLFWSTPEGLLKAVADPPAPPQYLRTITAELMGRPERANRWNMDPELDRKLWSSTVTRLAPYLR